MPVKTALFLQGIRIPAFVQTLIDAGKAKHQLDEGSPAVRFELTAHNGEIVHFYVQDENAVEREQTGIDRFSFILPAAELRDEPPTEFEDEAEAANYADSIVYGENREADEPPSLAGAFAELKENPGKTICEFLAVIVILIAIFIVFGQMRLSAG